MKKLALTLILSIASICSWADDSGTCGENLTWTYVEATQTLTISGTGEMSNYDYDNNSPWYSYGSSITNVIIESGVTSIGSGAFSDCSGLTSITIPNSVTSIGRDAFAWCNGLTKAEFASIESLCQMKFESQSSNPLYYAHHLFLNGVEIKDLQITNGVTSIGDYAFSYCSGLTSITIPNSVTSIGRYAFANCNGLTKAEFASIEALCNIEFEYGANPLLYAHHLYIDGKEVTDVIIPNSVYSISSYAFRGCSGLTSVIIPNNVKYICDFAFEDCSGLTSVTINNGVKHIGRNAFDGCSSLTSISIPESVDHIGGGAFDECKGLAKAEFASIEALCNIQFGDTAYASNPLYYAHHLYIEGKEVTDVIIPNSVVSIGSLAFDGCSGLTSITIPNSVTSIGSEAFSGCSGLTSVIIPTSVTSIGSYAFEGCSNLSLVISEAKNPTIGSSVFYGIASNAILSIPPFSEEAYKNCTQYFADYTTDLKVGNLYFNLDDDGDGTAWVEKSILDKKPYSGNIVIPSSVTYEGVEYPVVGIDDNAFKDATITSIVIPDGVKYIEDAAFYNCENLTSIVIPKTVRSIGESAFMYCDEVEALVCRVKNPFPISGKGAEGATFSNYFFNNVPLYVPKGTAETYRETEGWKDFVIIEEGTDGGGIVPQDVNGDGRVDTQDVLEIYNYIKEH